MMKSIFSVFVLEVFIAILVLECPESNAKAFINPFNVAIQTKFSEDGGNVFSFVYPKKSHQVSFKVHSENIYENEFDFASFISFLLKKIGRKFAFLNPFKLSSMPPTTTESNFGFSEEVTDDNIDESKEGSNEETENSSKETSEVPDENENSNEEISSTENNNEHTSSTTEIDETTRSLSKGYLPPISTPSYWFELPKAK